MSKLEAVLRSRAGPAPWVAAQGASILLNFSSLRECESIVDIDAQIANRVLDIGMPQQYLHRPQVTLHEREADAAYWGGGFRGKREKAGATTYSLCGRR